MFKIEALPAFTDNYIWLLQNHDSRCCAVVDPGDAAPVQAWLAEHPDWQLSDILITHHHFDHVGGVEQLKAATGACVWGPAQENIPARDQALEDGQHITVLGMRFEVLWVPGHTRGHIAYFHTSTQAPVLFCGDTLFAGGCGRLFEGTPAQMHASLERLSALPAATLVYCTHEYTLSNLRFANAVEPDNAAISARLLQVQKWRENGRISLPSSIELERATNPFLRCQTDAVTKKVTEPADPCSPDSTEVFARLRRWKDSF